nr:odorant binding protein 13 [Apriona germarii]
MRVFATVAVVVVALAACCTGQYSAEEAERITNNREACIAETKVDISLIAKADQGDFADDDKLKCFTKCFYQKAGFVTEKGDLLLDPIKAKMPPSVDKEKAIKVVENCKKPGKNACETVFLVHKCYFEYTQRNNLEKAIETSEATEKAQEQTEAPKEVTTKSNA